MALPQLRYATKLVVQLVVFVPCKKERIVMNIQIHNINKVVIGTQLMLTNSHFSLC